MKTLPLTVLLAATALSLPDHWLHNPRERTDKGVEEWQRKEFAAADRHLEQALELGGETPRGLFNAGTGRLGAGAPGAALPLLTRAAEAAAKDPLAQALQPEVLYNLGNAYLAAGDASNAVESYQAALRLQPNHQAAKHNLELALEEQRKNEQEQQQQNDQQQQQNQGGDQQQPQEGGGSQGQQPPQPQPQAPQPQGGQPQGGQPQQGQAQRSPRLPGFNPQKDMSAEQAASLLEAVENLEREQRRARAEQQRRDRARTATEKDW